MTRPYLKLTATLMLVLTSPMVIADSFTDWAKDYEPLYRGYACGDVSWFDEPEKYVLIAVTEEIVDEESVARLALVKISDREYMGGAHQEGLDYRVDFGFEEGADTHYAIVVQNDGSAGFYDFGSKEAKENDGYVTPSRNLECERQEQKPNSKAQSSKVEETGTENAGSVAERVEQSKPESQQEALSGLDHETRQSIELACITKKGDGPLPHRRCIENQLRSIEGMGSAPDLSGLDRETRQSIELACITEKGDGPVPHRRCIKEQLRSIGR